MTEEKRNSKRAEDAAALGDVIADTVPAKILPAVEKYYARRGYRLQGFTLVGGAYEATFVRREES